METRKTPYQEITSPENAEIHGTLRQGTWKGLQTLRARAKFLRATGFDWAAEALEDFNQTILRTSGSIEGKHRDSTVQAVQGQKAPTIALAAQPQQQANGEVKTHRVGL